MAPLKIQPIDIDSEKVTGLVRNEPVSKWRLRRFFAFEKQFPKNNNNNKDGGGGGAELEPSSVCLAKMVQSFMEEQPQPQPQPPPLRCGRNRCNCFNASSSDEDDFDLSGFTHESVADSNDSLKSLIPCVTVEERNLLADAAKIVEKNSKVYKRKEDLIKIVSEALSSLGYDSSICKSKWEKTSSCPAGEYQFIDAIVEGETLIIDIDFRSEFEIARSTGTYKTILQSLPYIFVGKKERLKQIVSIVSEAAKQSLKKKGMHVPPWRKRDYMLAKWISPSAARSKQVADAAAQETPTQDVNNDSGELELIFGEVKATPEEVVTVSPAWQLPAVKPKSVERGTKVVTGLASLLKEKP
ncbi:unnamed protein product [Lathyrus oleraceus]|uniref:DUF506 family protein n=1 Tax=Pisum sativum TaxID=3888 RepID=A0A9D4W793_PEA|nr:uncharacterized protein LOC127093606 [Pisum sativum]KAI5397408.1 hypothetical protein KIW84_063283 [Pisum sativum]KAI5397409.1 hypothetical protein KIW84_063283 [Pisum sativum]